MDSKKNNSYYYYLNKSNNNAVNEKSSRPNTPSYRTPIKLQQQDNNHEAKARFLSHKIRTIDDDIVDNDWNRASASVPLIITENSLDSSLNTTNNNNNNEFNFYDTSNDPRGHHNIINDNNGNGMRRPCTNQKNDIICATNVSGDERDYHKYSSPIKKTTANQYYKRLFSGIDTETPTNEFGSTNTVTEMNVVTNHNNLLSDESNTHNFQLPINEFRGVINPNTYVKYIPNVSTGTKFLDYPPASRSYTKTVIKNTENEDADLPSVSYSHPPSPSPPVLVLLNNNNKGNIDNNNYTDAINNRKEIKTIKTNWELLNREGEKIAKSIPPPTVPATNIDNFSTSGIPTKNSQKCNTSYNSYENSNSNSSENQSSIISGDLSVNGHFLLPPTKKEGSNSNYSEYARGEDPSSNTSSRYQSCLSSIIIKSENNDISRRSWQKNQEPVTGLIDFEYQQPPTPPSSYNLISNNNTSIGSRTDSSQKEGAGSEKSVLLLQHEKDSQDSNSQNTRSSRLSSFSSSTDYLLVTNSNRKFPRGTLLLSGIKAANEKRCEGGADKNNILPKECSRKNHGERRRQRPLFRRIEDFNLDNLGFVASSPPYTFEENRNLNSTVHKILQPTLSPIRCHPGTPDNTFTRREHRDNLSTPVTTISVSYPNINTSRASYKNIPKSQSSTASEEDDEEPKISKKIYIPAESQNPRKMGKRRSSLLVKKVSASSIQVQPETLLKKPSFPSALETKLLPDDEGEYSLTMKKTPTGIGSPCEMMVAKSLSNVKASCKKHSSKFRTESTDNNNNNYNKISNKPHQIATNILSPIKKTPLIRRRSSGLLTGRSIKKTEGGGFSHSPKSEEDLLKSTRNCSLIKQLKISVEHQNMLKSPPQPPKIDHTKMSENMTIVPLKVKISPVLSSDNKEVVFNNKSRNSVGADSNHHPILNEEFNLDETHPMWVFGKLIKSIQLIKDWAGGKQPQKIDEGHDTFLEKFAMMTGDTAVEEKKAKFKERARAFCRLVKTPKAWVVDPAKNSYYYWCMVVTIVMIYNLVTIIARCVFTDLQTRYRTMWFVLDYFGDFINILDIGVRLCTGYLEQGLLVNQHDKLMKAYIKTMTFKFDLICILPTDLLYLKFGTDWTVARFNRLFKFSRFREFFTRTESRTTFPNVFRIINLMIYIIIIIHWNACIYFYISLRIGLGSDGWVYKDVHEPGWDDLATKYIYSFYWSTLTLTTIGETPRPERDEEYLFVVIDFMIGVLIFATIVGDVGAMMTNANAARAEFRNKMDAVKRYMELRKVRKDLERRVIKWFDYLWINNRHSLNEEENILSHLPDKLKAEIAINVHLDTLRRVTIFKDCEPGLLVELIMKLKLQVFSPGDYICRKGDVGKEMYILKRGKLNVVSEDGRTVYATLSDGSVFGELSILNIPGNKTGNRRTANVRSLGYSDVFCLSKDDLAETLEDYPEAKKILLERGKEILKKDNLLDEDAYHKAEEFQKEGTAQERLIDLEKKLDSLQTKFARLLAEFTNSQFKLKRRITTLENKRNNHFGGKISRVESLKREESGEGDVPQYGDSSINEVDDEKSNLQTQYFEGASADMPRKNFGSMPDVGDTGAKDLD